MTDAPAAPPNAVRRVVGVVLAVAGVLMLAALCIFIAVALNYRASFTGSLPPLLDFAEGLAMLSPIILVALLLIWYGRWLLRKG